MVGFQWCSMPDTWHFKANMSKGMVINVWQKTVWKMFWKVFLKQMLSTYSIGNPYWLQHSLPRGYVSQVRKKKSFIWKGSCQFGFFNSWNLSFPGAKSFEHWSPDTRTQGLCGGGDRMSIFGAWVDRLEKLIGVRKTLHFSCRKPSALLLSVYLIAWWLWIL